MYSKKLLNAVTATGDSAALKFGSVETQTIKVQVSITGGTATVVLYGALDRDNPVWVSLHSGSTSELFEVVAVPVVKFNVSAIGGGAAVSAWVAG